MRSLPTREESERHERYQRERRQRALDSLAASGAHWHVDADGVLRCKVGHKVMAEKRLSTEFIEDAEAAISIEPDQED
ncbi:MAG TPA: hypothetical protein P5118_24190 [Planctomycetota bacterium]|nr:hypothetical protein [Planctomycetota bacterium]